MLHYSREELVLNESIYDRDKDNMRASIIFSVTFLTLFLITFFCILFSGVSYMPMSWRYEIAEAVLACFILSVSPIVVGLIVIDSSGHFSILRCDRCKIE